MPTNQPVGLRQGLQCPNQPEPVLVLALPVPLEQLPEGYQQQEGWPELRRACCNPPVRRSGQQQLRLCGESSYFASKGC